MRIDRHSDHMAGLSHVLSVNPKVKIYAPQDGLGGIYGSSNALDLGVPATLLATADEVIE
jgi:metal-dependent hydrolase (beta-lactamase superfamily II)